MSGEPTLDPDRLIANARAETGLTELDEPDIEVPLRVLTRALREEARLTPGGRYFWSGRLHGILIARLRGRDWVRRHPEILEERVPPPLVILGLSRTGTTLLHRLFHAEQPRQFARRAFIARCRCSRERIDRVLRSIRREELDDLRDSSGKVAVKCEFCSTEYIYDDHDLDRIYASAA